MRNAVKTVVFLVVLGGLFMGIGLLLGGTTGLTIGLALGLAFVGGSYWFSDTLAIKAARAQPVARDQLPQVYEIVEELTQRSGMPMPRIYVSPEAQPNAFATGRNPNHASVAFTAGILRLMSDNELEGVIAHELAHVKRGDNGVSCIGIALGTLFGGERTLRRCVGENREYRADVVGASVVRYPRGLLGALCTMMDANSPHEGSIFAAPRFGGIRWVWTDPSVGHREDPVYPGDLDATWVRAAALSEW